MKEILYIQAGKVSNYIGTHFWNAQESYFTYGDDDSELLVDHDVSFREGLSSQKEQTFCPRALVIDHKSNFGPLSKYNGLYSDPQDEADQLIWNGDISEYRQDAIPKSAYQKRLEDEEDLIEDANSGNDKDEDPRYWSDFNRVYYHPRSLQQVSDLPEWETNKIDWNYRKSAFERFDKDNSLTEDSLRRFVEECDNFQGFQVSFDNSTFGGFTVSMIENIRNEYAKAPLLTFPLLSGLNPRSVGAEDVIPRNLILQDIACVCALNEVATQSIILQSPESWQLGTWSSSLEFDKNSIYHASSILSSHIESSTLPLRLKSRRIDLSDLCTHLNWAQNTRFSHLSGALPFPSKEIQHLTDGNLALELDRVLHGRVYDFSCYPVFAGQNDRKGSSLSQARGAGIHEDEENVWRRTSYRNFVQRNVTRGLKIDEARSMETYFTSSTGLEYPLLSSTHAEPYPLPSSFPKIFKSGSSPSSTSSFPTSIPTPHTFTSVSTSASTLNPTSTSLLSTLSTTTKTGKFMHGYVSFARHVWSSQRSRVARGSGGGGGVAGLEADEVKELVESLETLVDAYEYDYGDEGEDEEGDEDMMEEGMSMI